MNVSDAISTAGRQRVLLLLTYDGDTRHVEPYSYRDKGGRRLFFGYCHKCNEINAFDPNKITHIEVTNIPFAPRWPIEV